MKATICSFDASELKESISTDVELLRDRRTDGPQLKEGIGPQICKHETLAMLLGQHSLAAALFFMAGVC
jgi:hypothetical protein